MLNFDIFKQKSPKQRFLLILGLIMFVFYIVLGAAFIFWKELPLNMSRTVKIAIGIFLIIYAFVRLLSLGRKD
jgi:membrane protease YdiL (CAAX protease family)